MSLPPVNRRQALTGLVSVSLGALLAACAEDEKTGEAGVATTAASEPRTRSGGDLADLFDDTSSCTLTPS
jgi:hypothetical protein